MSVPQKAIEGSTGPRPWYFNPADPDLTEEEKYYAEAVVKEYEDEKKLFPRQLLEDIKTKLENHKKENPDGAPVHVIQNYVGGSRRPIVLNLGSDGNMLNRLDYVPVQRLMNPRWYGLSRPSDEGLLRSSPIGIASYCMDTLEENRNSTEDFNKRWKDDYDAWVTNSKTRKTILAALDENVSVEELNAVKKLIAFEVGSLWRSYPRKSNDDTRFNKLRNRVRQHALIADIRDYVHRKTGNEVKAYVQDPTYTASDKPFLQSLKLEQLQDPQGFLMIDGDTLVYSIKASIPVMQILVDVFEKKPAMILWRHYIERNSTMRPDSTDHDAVRSDPMSPRVEKLISTYWPRKLGNFDNAFLYGIHTRLHVGY